MVEPSALDDYDDENGYKDDVSNVTKWVDIFFWLIRYGIKAHRMSFKECMDMDICDYIDFLEFDIVRSPEKNDEVS